MTRAEEQIEFIRQLNETLRVQYDAIVADNMPTGRLKIANLLGREQKTDGDERTPECAETEPPTGQVRPTFSRP